MQIFQNALNQKSAKKCTKEAKNQFDEENEMCLKFNFTTEKRCSNLNNSKITFFKLLTVPYWLGWVC